MSKRTPHGLRRNDVLKLQAATRHSDVIGQPLNQFLTIHWVMTASHGGNPDKGLEQLKARQRAWLHRKGYGLIFVWVHECGRSEEVHTHIALHISPHLQEEHEQMLDKWLDSACDGVSLIKEAYGVEGLTKYLCKGVIDSKTAEEFGIRQEPQGEINHKRCGISQNLGPKARQKWAEEAKVAFAIAAE